MRLEYYGPNKDVGRTKKLILQNWSLQPKSCRLAKGWGAQLHGLATFECEDNMCMKQKYMSTMLALIERKDQKSWYRKCKTILVSTDTIWQDSTQSWKGENYWVVRIFPTWFCHLYQTTSRRQEKASWYLEKKVLIWWDSFNFPSFQVIMPYLVAIWGFCKI